jgi:hypothetical protein
MLRARDFLCWRSFYFLKSFLELFSICFMGICLDIFSLRGVGTRYQKKISFVAQEPRSFTEMVLPLVFLYICDIIFSCKNMQR